MSVDRRFIVPRRFFFLSKISSGGKQQQEKRVFVASLKGGGWKQGRVADGMDEIRHVEMDTVWIVSVCRKRRKKGEKKEEIYNMKGQNRLWGGGRQIFFP